MKEDMQRERLTRFMEFTDDVKNSKCQTAERVVKAPENLVSDFLDEIAKAPKQ